MKIIYRSKMYHVESVPRKSIDECDTQVAEKIDLVNKDWIINI